MLGSNTDSNNVITKLSSIAKNLGANDQDILDALSSKEGSNSDSRKIIGLLRLISDKSDINKKFVTDTFIFTLEDGTEVVKEVYVKS